MGGIDAVDVETRVGLGIAQFLGVGEHGLELGAGLAHGGEDIIAGAVENPVDPR